MDTKYYEEVSLLFFSHINSCSFTGAYPVLDLAPGRRTSARCIPRRRHGPISYQVGPLFP